VKCPFFRRGMVRVHVGGDMNYYGATVQEWRMKVQEVILRAMAKKITWWQAAEILGISDRQMRRWKHRYDDYGYDGLYDRRRGKPSPRRVPVERVEKVLGLYRAKYFDLNVRHFREKLVEERQIGLSYTWVKLALQASPPAAVAGHAAASGWERASAGFRTTAGMIRSRSWTTPPMRSTTRSWWRRNRRGR